MYPDAVELAHLSRTAVLAVPRSVLAITIVFGATAALALAAHAALHRAFGARGGLLDRAVAALLVSLATSIAIVVVLGRAGHLTRGTVVCATALVVLVGWTAAGANARGAVLRDVASLRSLLRSALLGGTWSIAAWVGIAAMLIACAAAYLLPVWAWDALGYHLPLVHDVLATGRLRTVPTHIPYVNVYPHLVDLHFVWFRALLPDDTWIDAAQIPFALLAVASTAALAERAGVRAGRAVAFALVFLAIPAVALQLATNYVDVAYAALLIAAVHFLFAQGPTFANLALGALSLGLFLGTKPSAPVPVVVLLVGLIVRHRGVRIPTAIGVTALAVGGASYIENLVRFGNPVWPVQMKLGPMVLPGLESATHFFDLGVEEPYRSYGWLHRLVASLYAAPTRFVYDMRIGGFGPVVGWMLLPVALFVLVRARARAGASAVLAIAALATPAAFWARYTLGFAAALLVLVATGTETMRPYARRSIEVSLAVVAALGLYLATPGFTDGRMSLLALARVDAAERAARFGGVDGAEGEWSAARAHVLPGLAAAYDRSLGFPARLWDGRGTTRIVYVGDLEPSTIAATLRRERVRIAVLDPVTAAGVRDSGLPLVPLFTCRVDPCVVYRLPE